MCEWYVQCMCLYVWCEPAVCVCAWVCLCRSVCVYVCAVCVCMWYVCMHVSVCGMNTWYVCKHVCMQGYAVCIRVCVVQTCCVCVYVHMGGEVIKTQAHITEHSQLPAAGSLSVPGVCLCITPVKMILTPTVSGFIVCRDTGAVPGQSRPPRALFTLLHCHPLHPLLPAQEAAAVTLDLSSQLQKSCRKSGRRDLALGK